MKKWLIRLALFVPVFVVLLVVVVYVKLTQSLPQLDGELTLDHLHADVRIERDASGIPTIQAENRIDLAFATGYVHGQDRFFQMDLSRRKAAGELAEIVGPAALAIDRSSRLHRFRFRADTALTTLDAPSRQVLDAYVAGVNAGLEGLQSKPFEYFLLGSEPRPWNAADSLLVGYAMYFELNDETADRDIDRGLAFRVLPLPVFEWLFPSGTEWDAALDGTESPTIPIPADYKVAGKSARTANSAAEEAMHDLTPGSNNWAVSGRLTGNGRAIVANDMHLGLSVPNVFYRARLMVSGTQNLDLNGVTLPGVPILVAGSNGSVAWSSTNSNGDWIDAVVLRPGDEPNSYLTPSGSERITTVNETILVKNQESVALPVRETVWGPILAETPDSTQTIALSWIAHHAEAVTLGHLGLETAKTAAEALNIASTIGAPPQNLVVGDAEGSIGWTIAGRIPIRPDGDSTLPVDWSESGGWSGWVRTQDYPQVLNPESGLIWTANARVIGGDGVEVIGDGGYALGARAKQIRDDLFALEEYTPADMLDIQLDDRAVFLSRWRTLLLATLETNAIVDNDKRQLFRQLVENWRPRATVDNVGYRLVDAFRLEAGGRVTNMLLQPIRDRFGSDTYLPVSKQFEAPLWALLNDKPAHMLVAEYANWNELLLQSVDTVIAEFAEQYDDGLENRTWGEKNTARIRHPLSSAVPFLSSWLDMPADELGGARDMPRVQWPAFGASERFAVAPGDEQNGYLHMPSGQSGHPLSDFYSAGHSDWVEGRPSPFLPTKPLHTLLLRAAN